MTYIPFAMARQAIRAGKGIQVNSTVRVLAYLGDTEARSLLLHPHPHVFFWVHGLLVSL